MKALKHSIVFCYNCYTASRSIYEKFPKIYALYHISPLDNFFYQRGITVFDWVDLIISTLSIVHVQIYRFTLLSEL